MFRSQILTNWTIMKAADGTQATDAFSDAPPDAQDMLLRLTGQAPLLVMI